MKKLSLEDYAKKYGDALAVGTSCELFEAEGSDYSLPRRNPHTHKYSYGRALIIAGCRGYSGAPSLAANACERSGAGLTWLMVPESIYSIVASRCDGAVVTPLPATTSGGIAEEAIPQVLEALKKASACVIGPGLGADAETRKLVCTVLHEATCPLILDADGLNACADAPDVLDCVSAPLLITPHEGEFKRLGGDLSKGRLAGAFRFCERHPHLTLMLKGYGTLICRDASARVNLTGGPAMAKGGSGDVLSGILCSLLAQGFEPQFAAGCAVWLHGLSGDLAAGELSEYSVTPGDLIRFLPRAFKSLNEQ